MFCIIVAIYKLSRILALCILAMVFREDVVKIIVRYCDADYQPTPHVFIVAKTKLELETA